MARLAATQLIKTFNNRNVVNGVSMHVETGEIVGLLGPNGAGKTTSFYMMVGLIKADDGRILLNSEDITYHPMHVRAQMGIGYLPQEPSIFRKLSQESLTCIFQNMRWILSFTNWLNCFIMKLVRRELN